MPKNEIIRLLQIYVGAIKESEIHLSESEWEAVWKECRRQGLTGILNRVINSLPIEQCPECITRAKIGLTAEAIASRNALMDGRCIDIVAQMRSMGLDCCVLKGQGFARLYPHPEDRMPGDIDLWVKGDMKDTLAALRSRWEVGKVFYHHAGIHPFDKKTEVEVHFRPSWMNSPFTDRKLQNYFKAQAGRPFRNVDGLTVPETGFDCVFCAVHIYRHLLSEGIGMRQIMDCHYILLHSSERERDEAAGVLRDLGMTRFVRALMYALQEWFRLDSDHLLMPPDGKYGRFLMKEIMLSGNFGRHDSRYSIKDSDPVIKRAVKKMSRLSRFITIAPSEVLWAPVFKIWQHLWRRGIPNTCG